MRGAFAPVVSLVLLSAVAACSTAPPMPAAPPAGPEATVEQPRFTQVGVASIYARKFDGKRTAEGERFDWRALTAAHRHLPFNTIVRVTNMDTGKTVKVRINDRGPYVKHRVIDISPAAGSLLGIQEVGIARVRLAVFASDQLPEHEASSGN